ncbi:DUF4760 domain-containing protein [Prosthecomicrobium sp. N25]|uniref:DUF4760 domain-containing protein n=1 Tax=Prosthecomicrobium sp. N25 TaxID=3129254 RepID=UPI0030771321
MTSRPADISKTEQPLRPGRVAGLRRPAAVLGLTLFATAGWGWAAYERFVEVPHAAARQRVATSLDLLDKWADGEAQRAYVKLSEELKPWWTMIQDQQRRIMAARSDQERDALIASRDDLLLAFIREHDLAASVELLVDAFDQFDRCITLDACDEEIIRKSIAIDVKRIYRTFKPFIQARRDTDNTGERDKDFGKGLEDLFFRFLS